MHVYIRSAKQFLKFLIPCWRNILIGGLKVVLVYVFLLYSLIFVDIKHLILRLMRKLLKMLSVRLLRNCTFQSQLRQQFIWENLVDRKTNQKLRLKSRSTRRSSKIDEIKLVFIQSGVGRGYQVDWVDWVHCSFNIFNTCPRSANLPANRSTKSQYQDHKMDFYGSFR